MCVRIKSDVHFAWFWCSHYIFEVGGFTSVCIMSSEHSMSMAPSPSTRRHSSAVDSHFLSSLDDAQRTHANVQAHSLDEVEDFVCIASSLLINMGTLEPDWIQAMQLAATKCVELGKPWVLDPVAAGDPQARSTRSLKSSRFLSQIRQSTCSYELQQQYAAVQRIHLASLQSNSLARFVRSPETPAPASSGCASSAGL